MKINTCLSAAMIICLAPLSFGEPPEDMDNAEHQESEEIVVVDPALAQEFLDNYRFIFFYHLINELKAAIKEGKSDKLGDICKMIRANYFVYWYSAIETARIPRNKPTEKLVGKMIDAVSAHISWDDPVPWPQIEEHHENEKNGIFVDPTQFYIGLPDKFFEDKPYHDEIQKKFSEHIEMRKQAEDSKRK